jgi:hypothetical protein
LLRGAKWRAGSELSAEKHKALVDSFLADVEAAR